MTDLRRMTYDELMRECKRRGLRVTREPVPLTPEEDRVIRLLVLAAELHQAHAPYCRDACMHALESAYLAAPLASWLERFARAATLVLDNASSV